MQIKKAAFCQIKTWGAYCSVSVVVADTETGEEKHEASPFQYGSESHAEHEGKKLILHLCGLSPEMIEKNAFWAIKKEHGIWCRFAYQETTKRAVIENGKM